MFKWKVYVYRNNNGKEEELEKEFDNPQEFNNFRNTYTQSKHDGPYLGLWDWANLQNFFNDLIDRRFWLWYANEDSYEENEENECLPGWVDLDAYEQELQKIEYNKNHKAEEIQKIKDTLSKLKDYRKKFKDEWRDDMIEKIDKDIENMKKKLDELEK
jgi:hypothetical protein